MKLLGFVLARFFFLFNISHLLKFSVLGHFKWLPTFAGTCKVLSLLLQSEVSSAIAIPPASPGWTSFQ